MHQGCVNAMPIRNVFFFFIYKAHKITHDKGNMFLSIREHHHASMKFKCAYSNIRTTHFANENLLFVSLVYALSTNRMRENMGYKVSLLYTQRLY